VGLRPRPGWNRKPAHHREADGALVKITALRTFLVPPRWLFLKIETDAGVSGWGEPVLRLGRPHVLGEALLHWAPGGLIL
jgi:hypothetical protein